MRRARLIHPDSTAEQLSDYAIAITLGSYATSGVCFGVLEVFAVGVHHETRYLGAFSPPIGKPIASPGSYKGRRTQNLSNQQILQFYPKC